MKMPIIPKPVKLQMSKMKYLPPGTIYDLFRQFNATTGNRCSWHCFHSCWTEEFKHKLTFCDKYVFSICPVCVQHKLLLRGFGADSSAALRQRMLYDRHLASQFEDRKCYWSMRASSRLRSKIILAIIDGMDQAKYAIPRSSLFQSHTFDKYTRPRLHVWVYCVMVLQQCCPSVMQMHRRAAVPLVSSCSTFRSCASIRSHCRSTKS